MQSVRQPISGSPLIIISHRGNLYGPDPERENKVASILSCIEMGFEVEIDCYYIDGEFYLGHDSPEEKITIDFLLQHINKLWVHAKSLETLTQLLNWPQINCFFHDKDDYTLTSLRYIWGNKKVASNNKCVMVMDGKDYCSDCFGICTDYPVLSLLKRNRDQV